MPDTYAPLRTQLISERASLLAHVGQIASDEAEWTESIGQQRKEMLNEGDTISVERSVLAQLSASALKTLDDIESALQRMDAGTYGHCVECAGEIPFERLEVRPYATACVRCASRR